MITQPVALNRFQRCGISKRADRCFFCNAVTSAGTDYWALDNGKFIGVCALHAASIVEQCKALVLLIQAEAAGLDATVLAEVDAHCPADIAAVLADEADGVTTVAAALKLTDALGVVRSHKPAVAPVRSNKFAGKCVTCGTGVAAGAGRLDKIDGKFVTYHLDGECPTPTADEKVMSDEAFAAVVDATNAILAEHGLPLVPKPDYVAAATVVPEGRYALVQDGEVKFYRVEHGAANGRWAGYVFVSAQASDDLYPIRNRAARTAILDAIAADPHEAVALYGRELGVCGKCGKTLTSEYRKLGVGPVCINKAW